MSGETVIQRIKADLTGDGIPEVLTLTGTRADGSAAFESIRIAVQDGASCRVSRIEPPEDIGYDPRVWVGPLISAGSREILLSIASGGSGGIGFYTVYTYWDGGYRAIFDSERYNARYAYEVSYRDKYVVEAASLTNGAAYNISLAGKGAEYLGALYSADGALMRPHSGGVNPLSLLYPAEVGLDGVNELVAYQRITGLYNADGLGDFINRLRWSGTDFALAEQTVGIFRADKSAS